MATDPYTLVYNALHKFLSESPALTAIAPRWAANFVSFDKGHGQDQIREVVKDADLPEVILESRTVSGNLNLTSNATQIVREYTLSARVGTGAIGNTLYCIEWAATCALVESNFDQKLRELSWAGQSFVKNIRLVSAVSGDTETDVTRGLRGWAAVWTVSVEMVFNQAIMRNFAKGLPLTQGLQNV